MIRRILLLGLLVGASACGGDDSGASCEKIPDGSACSETKECIELPDYWWEADGKRFYFEDGNMEQVWEELLGYCCEKTGKCGAGG